MRLLLSLNLLLLLPFICSAQYLPVAVENAHWIIYDGNGIEFDTTSYKHYVLTIRGDSVINDTLYKKIVIREYYPEGRDERDALPPYRISPDARIYALLRDDTTQQKLYGRVPGRLYDASSPWTADTLIHNYSGGAGDSITGYYFSSPMEIDSVVTRTLFGSIRNTQFNMGGGSMDEFYEGFGMIAGGPLTYFDTMRLAQGEPIVIDYCIGTDAECQLDQTTSTKLMKNAGIEIFPSPSASWINIKLTSSTSDVTTVILLTLEGRAIRSTVVPAEANQTKISIEEVPAGIFFIDIRQGNQRWIRKMVRQ